MITFHQYLSSLSRESATLKQAMTYRLRIYCEKAAYLRYGGIKVNIVDVFRYISGIPDDSITKEDINNCVQIATEFCRNFIEMEPHWSRNIITIIWEKDRPTVNYLNI